MRLGPYEILSPIGAGGMGEVYRALDTRLGRRVAIKVPPEELARNPAALARFEREARAVASLAHPNVLDLHDFGSDGGVHYAVTELLEGETLRARLADGPLPWREAIEIAAAVADGLAATHAGGIVHRDLKPENIFLTKDGRIKILDFGLARVDLERPPGDSGTIPGATESGMLLGTVGYMSPEQVRGERADARSDIFSLGCVLYEMVTGRHAFQAASAPETLVAILREDAGDPAAHCRDCPEELRRIIGHCLAKRAEMRTQSARDLALSLRDLQNDRAPSSAVRRLLPRSPVFRRPMALSALVLAACAAVALLALRSTVGRGGRIASVAVLPFVNASGDRSADYLSDGLSEGLIRRLAMVPGLRVPAGATVFASKNEADPRRAGRALNVAAVLVGRVSRRGDDVVVQTELVDVAGGSQLWSERFDRKAADLPGIPEEIAREITSRLQIRLTGAQKGPLAKPTEDAEAYDLYLQGRYQWNKRSGEGIVRSIDFFQRAIGRDPRFAAAFAGLAEAYDLLAFYGGAPPKQVLPKARDAAIRALEIDESLADAHTALADVRYQFEWDWAGAERGFRRALEIDPNSATSHQWYSNFLSLAGRFPESFREIESARRLDPLNLMIRTDEGMAQYWAGRDDRAKALLERTLQLEPAFPLTHFYLGVVATRQRSFETAIGEARVARRLSEDEPDPIALYGYVCALAGRREEAATAMRDLEELSSRRFVDAFLMAGLAVGMGDKERALASLERAYEERSGRLVYLNVEHAFDPIRDDPRFRGLVQRLHFPVS